MLVNINTDNTLTADERMQTYFSDQINDSLERFESIVTRVEVYLKDEAGGKEGIDDITCTLEARIKGRKDVAVTCQDNTKELAVSGAIDKVTSVLDSVMGKIQEY